MTLPLSTATLLELTGAVVETRGGVRCAPVDLRLGPGECLVLCGGTGNGKSRLLRTVVGLAPLVGGSLRLLGEETRAFAHDDWMRVRHRVAFASEGAPLLSNLTVRDNLTLPLVVRGEAEVAARVQVDDALGRYGLEGVAPLRPHVLSGVQHRQLVLLRALLLPSSLLVLDDPPLGESSCPWRLAVDDRRQRGTAVLASAFDASAWGDCPRVHMHAR